MTDLIVLEKVKAEDLFTEKGKDWIVNEIKDKIKDFTPDISTPKGRKEIASLAHRIATSKTTIDKLRLDTVSEWKEKAKKIDQGGKLIRDALDELKLEVRKPLTEFEEAEKKRISDREDRINRIVSIRNQAISSIDQGKNFLDMLSNLNQFDWQEFKNRAERESISTKEYINENILRIQEIERQKAELARLEAERVEQERIDREKRIAENAERKAKEEAEKKAKAERDALIAEQEKKRQEQERLDRKNREAEQRKIEVEREKIEQEKREALRIEKQRQAEAEAKIEAERQERLRAERELQAEKDRIQAEKLAEQKRLEAEKAENARREADKEHRKSINNSIVNDFIKIGITKEQAMSIVKEIALKKVQHLTINY